MSNSNKPIKFAHLQKLVNQSTLNGAHVVETTKICAYGCSNGAKFSLFYYMCWFLSYSYSVIFFVFSFSSYLFSVSSYLYSVNLYIFSLTLFTFSIIVPWVNLYGVFLKPPSNRPPTNRSPTTDHRPPTKCTDHRPTDHWPIRNMRTRNSITNFKWISDKKMWDRVTNTISRMPHLLHETKYWPSCID